jgi:DNA helicase IV
VSTHPELDAEQAYIDHAHACLERSRDRAKQLRSMVEVGKGGTEQARWEREMIEESIAQRLSKLHLGDQSLVFGRLDTAADRASGRDADTFYIGRLAVSDDDQEPVVVDWRAPVAEPFYRATGRQPLGLARRRHFTTKGRRLLGMEDELFGEAITAAEGGIALAGDREIRGHGALIAALETSRSGKLGDIVATIQGEQDEVIRSALPGIVVVQGGPGTGKTVVALHRAAYLLYTHRFPLEGQGVLVVGPNRLFLGYIDQVLPSLGEAGVELAVLPDLVHEVKIAGDDHAAPARIKGDARMVRFLERAVADRERPLREDLTIGFGAQTLRLRAQETERIIAEARRRFRFHNAGRRHVESAVFDALTASARLEVKHDQVRDGLRRDPAIVEALERMWPVLSPAQLLHDLFGSKALLASAGSGRLSDAELAALHRPRSASVHDVVFTNHDVPLLDEAHDILGRRHKAREGHPDPEEVRTYGHIVVDEAQDLSPMQLRMLERRSLSGSMTIVGDIAQATGAWAHADWDEILQHLPTKRGVRRTELTIGYRIPARNMALAAKVLAVAAPWLQPPTSVREGGDEPRVLQAAPYELAAVVARITREERDAVEPGTVAVIAPASMVDDLSDALNRIGVDHGRATRSGLDNAVTVVPVGMVKGLELDASVVVEPAAIVEEEAQGLRALYVALTRSTKRLAVVHARPLPDFMQ